MAEAKKKPSNFVKVLRALYFYVVSAICVIVFIIGSVTLIKTALEAWVFPVTDGYSYDQSIYSCGPESMKGMSFANKDECVTYYKDQAETQNNNQRNRDLAFGVAMTVVSFPLWLAHLWMVKLDKKKDNE